MGRTYRRRDEGRGTRSHVTHDPQVPSSPEAYGENPRCPPGCNVWGATNSPPEILGYNQPRDFRIDGAPTRRRAVRVQLAGINTGQWAPRGTTSPEHYPRD
jgi:hypothetical protein